MDRCEQVYLLHRDMRGHEDDLLLECDLEAGHSGPHEETGFDGIFVQWSKDGSGGGDDD